jgi:23S rRNA pseudouridine2605 synthase
MPTEPHPEGERLQKLLASAGYGSRRLCEELVAAGRVSVNGTVVELGARARPGLDAVAVDGVPVAFTGVLVYYLLHKPVGVVSTASDPEGRRTVVELVPDEPRVFPVGRLDAATEGLLILTNDGELAHGLTHPSRGVDKTYLVEVEGVPTRAALRQLRTGVALDDGVTAPAKVIVIAERSEGSALQITIHEGRNRQVRRMCETVGHPVRRLVRTAIGPLTDQRLAAGQWRELTIAEVRELYAAAGLARPTPVDPTAARFGTDKRRPGPARGARRQRQRDDAARDAAAPDDAALTEAAPDDADVSGDAGQLDAEPTSGSGAAETGE